MKHHDCTLDSAESIPLKDQLSVEREDILHRSASRILHKIKQTLQEIRLQVEQHAREREANSSAPTVDLNDTWTRLDDGVISPLEELQQRINLSSEIVREVYEAQVEMLSGSSGDGIIQQLKEMKAKQKSIDERMNSIAEKLESQIQVCAGILAFSSCKAKKLTTGEREFKAELENYAKKQYILDSMISSLEKLQVTRSKLSVSNRAILTPPSGIDTRLQVQMSPGASPTTTADGRRVEPNKVGTTSIEKSFLNMGINTKTKKENAEKARKMCEEDSISHDQHDTVQSSLSPELSPEPTSQPEGFYNAYSTHTPFVSPLRGTGVQHTQSSDVFSQFQSPAASFGNNIVKTQPRSSSDHWTAHNYSIGSRKAGAPLRSVNRLQRSSVSRFSRTNYGPSHKRRQLHSEDEEAGISQISRKQHVESEGGDSNVATSPMKDNGGSLINEQIIEKLSKEVRITCYFLMM